jgi:hypothetical protein
VASAGVAPPVASPAAASVSAAPNTAPSANLLRVPKPVPTPRRGETTPKKDPLDGQY